MAPRRDEAARFRLLLRAGLVRRGPRRRPRDEGEMRAMARMAKARWERALATGLIERTPWGYRWNAGPPL